MSVIEFVTENSRKRPWWMNGLMLFCAYMTFIYVPWDFLSKPIDEAEEVWFGILLTGMAAKATEPLHWFIYFNGMRGFWRQKTWMHPWAALYTGQIAFGMLMWNINDPRGSGLVAGVITATPFLVVALLLWREKFRFRPINLGLPA
jgi:hypothetical protein